MGKYVVAKVTTGVLEGVGFGVIIVGASASYFVAIEFGMHFGILAGIVSALSGLSLVVIAQLTRTQIATAEDTAEMLKIMRASRAEPSLQKTMGAATRRS